jgi:hypothetical protein
VFTFRKGAFLGSSAQLNIPSLKEAKGKANVHRKGLKEKPNGMIGC